jgi:hypothetical protein
LLLHLAASFRATGPILLPPRWLCPASIPCRSHTQPPSVRQHSAICEVCCSISLEPGFLAIWKEAYVKVRVLKNGTSGTSPFAYGGSEAQHAGSPWAPLHWTGAALGNLQSSAKHNWQADQTMFLKKSWHLPLELW